jgi:hypothetical protein
MRVHVDNPASDPVKITGSLTPAGTQDVNIVSPDPLDVTVINPLSDPVHVTPVKDNSITGVYVFSADEIPGVAAANNYLSVFNPVGSGKNLYLGGVFISAVTAGGTTVTAPMRGFRTTTATGGVLQATSATAKFITAYPDSVAEVRTGNPTVTLGASLFNSPPPLSSGVNSTPVHQVPIPPNSAPFALAPGEGIVLREATGDTDLRWNLSIAWAEADV